MSQLSSLAAVKARLLAAKATPSVSSPSAAGGVPPRTPRVASPSTSLARGIEGIGELSLSGGGVASSVFVMTMDIMAGICRGSVKGGVRFCTHGGDSCPYKTHADKKVPVRPGVLYIAGGRNSAHTEPVLDVSQVSAGRLERLLSEQHTVPKWMQLFHVLAGFEDKLDDTEVDDIVQQVAEASLPIGKTPKRRRLAYGASLEEDPVTPKRQAFQFTPLGSLSEEDDQITRVLAQWDRLVSRVAELSENDDKNKNLICADLDAFGIQLKSLEARIGMDPSSDPSSNVWGGICELREESKEQGEVINQLVDEMEVYTADIAEERDLGVKRDAILRELKQAQDELAELTAFLNSEQEAVLKDMDVLRGKTASFGGAALRATGETSAGWRREAELLRGMMANTESEINIRMRAMETTIGVKLDETNRAMVEIKNRMDRDPGGSSLIRGEISALREKLKLIEARVSTKPVQIGGRTFLSYPDTLAYVIKNVPPNIYFLFHDVMTLLESMAEAYTSKSEVLLEMQAGKKVGFANEAEAIIVASFKTLMPTVFSKSKDGGVPSATGSLPLPAVKSYHAWNPFDGATGVKQFIEKGLDDLRLSLGNDVETFFVEHDEARMLASELLTRSRTFITDLCSWMDSFYGELISQSQITPEEAWELVAACVRKFFETIRTVRAPAANASSDTDASAKCAKYLWAIVQTHEIMKEFREYRFKGHPAIAPVVNFHVFRSRVTKTAFEKLNAAVTALNQRMSNFDSLQGRVAKLGKK